MQEVHHFTSLLEAPPSFERHISTDKHPYRHFVTPGSALHPKQDDDAAVLCSVFSLVFDVPSPVFAFFFGGTSAES
jgi:hypothetical protein